MDATTYRKLMGHFATGVTVITTDNEGWLHGMTANAMTSVSLDPLLLLVCVDRNARCHREIVAAGKFGVNILSAEQEEVSATFAQKGSPEQGRLRGVPFRKGPNGTPILSGCLASLECRVFERCSGGDHDIFVGEVLGGNLGDDLRPLLFYSGAYRRLAE
jgi:flavin reductase (DIM6/NTAB) family NADH-FMN oxidoreductase RutF